MTTQVAPDEGRGQPSHGRLRHQGLALAFWTDGLYCLHSMKLQERKRALRVAVEAAESAGAIMKRHLHSAKAVASATQHDIKLELDERCQRKIAHKLRKAFPTVSILGEEGSVGPPNGEHRWVVDPIDGTVNFTYGIPHACVSVALQQRVATSDGRFPEPGKTKDDSEYQSLIGVVYDPFCDELFTGICGQPATLNGRRIAVSQRTRLDQAIVSVGFAKDRQSLDDMLPMFSRLMHRVRKIRIMGAAALAMVYVASGRMDAYAEPAVRLWDIAAGGLILECAGGDYWHVPVAGTGAHTYRILANNGRLRRPLEKLL